MNRNSLFFSLLVLALLSAACTPSVPSPTPSRMPATPVPSSTPTAADTSAPEPTATALPTPTDEPTAIPAAFPEADVAAWERVVGGVIRPVDIVNAGDGSGRLFILQQVGVIRVLQDGQLLAEPFLDLRDRVGSAANEQGLLGIAFHPQFSRNGYFYVNYTDYSGDTVIARFTAPAGESGFRPAGDASSELILLRVDQPAANHNGGQLQFGPDGYLWIGLGDGGGQGDPNGYAQSPDSLLGKLLRIDVDAQQPYAIPADNPFAGGGGAPEIYALGLRNPWRFTFDRLTGDLFIADVGQNRWEEIDYLPEGFSGAPLNYGWNIREGAHPYRDIPTDALLTDPIHEYSHDAGCSITGGVVYRGEDIPGYRGIYLFGDYCSGTLWGLIPAADGGWQTQVLFQTGFKMAAFGEDEAGEVYLLDLNGGVYKLTARQ